MSDYHPYLADWDEDEQRAAKRYGVERGRITGTKGDASDETKAKAKRQTDLFHSYDKRMASAAYNDYDTRRSLEAAALSGSEEAKKFREQGFHNREDVTNLNNFFESEAKKHIGVNKFDKKSEYADLTNFYVDRDRNKLIESLTPDPTEEVEEKDKGFTDPEERTVSKELTDAKERVAAFNKGSFGESPFNEVSEGGVLGGSERTSTAPTEDIYAGVKNNSADFLNDYKAKVKNKKHFVADF